MSLRAVLTPRVRLWLYGLGIPTVPLLVSYGVVTADEGQLWLTWLGAALAVGGLGVAAANTPRGDTVAKDIDWKE